MMHKRLKQEVSYVKQNTSVYSGRSYVIYHEAHDLKSHLCSGQSPEVGTINTSEIASKAGFFLNAPWLVETWITPPSL